MDPLSITASVIAIVQAVNSIGTIVKTIESLGNASDEFLALINELSLLRAILEHVKVTLETVDTSSTGTSPIGRDVLRVLQQDLAQISNDLNEVAVKLITSINGRDQDGMPRVSKVRWHKEKSNVLRLREKAQKVQTQMLLTFTTMNTSQIAIQGGLIIDVQSMIETTYTGFQKSAEDGFQNVIAGQVATQSIQQAIQADLHVIKKRIKDIDPLRDKLERLDLQNLKEGQRDLKQSNQRIEAHLRHLVQQRGDGTSQLSIYDQIPSRNKRYPGVGHPSSNSSDHGLSDLQTRAIEAVTGKTSRLHSPGILNSNVLLSGTLRQTCPRLCKCQCHTISRINTPRLLQTIMGSLCIQYNSIPIFDRRPCNNPLCRSNSRTLIRLHYRFPSWMIARAIRVYVSSRSLIYLGASMHLKIPRVNNSPNLTLALYYDDIDWLKQNISQKKLFMTDIFESGESVLSRAVRYRNWQVIRFLLRAGFDHTIQDMSGHSFIHDMRFELYSNGIAVFPRDIRAILPRLIDVDEEFEPRSITSIHDSISGVNQISLPQALQMEPFKKDDTDHMGFTPLQWAVIKNDLEAVETLLSFGADPNRPSAQGISPLDLACRRETSLSIISGLLNAGAQVDARTLANETALHNCCSNVQVINILLRHGADPNSKNMRGETPLHRRARYHEDNLVTFRESVTALLEGGADLEHRDDHGFTSLTTTMITNPLASVEMIRLGANTDIRLSDGSTLLHYVARYWKSNEIEALRQVDLGPIDPTAVDFYGAPPLGELWARMISTESSHYAGWHRPVVGAIWSFTVLILEINERNWNAGRFLDAREKELADGSYRQMKNWVIKQQRKMREDESLYHRPWNSADTWYHQEELDGERHVPESRWEDDDSSNTCVEEDDDGSSDTDSLADHKDRDYEVGPELDGSEDGGDADTFFDAEEFQVY